MSSGRHFPLRWPDCADRWTGKRLPSRFPGHTFAAARTALVDEIKRLGGQRVVISSNVRPRPDGMPYAGEKPTGGDQSPGIAVYWIRGGVEESMACEVWDDPTANIVAILKTVEAWRGLARWGVQIAIINPRNIGWVQRIGP